MDLPAQLAADIVDLFDRTEGASAEFHEPLDGVRRALVLAVPSYASLSLSLTEPLHTVQLDIVEPRVPTTIGSSLLLPLDRDGFAAGSSLTVFAATQGSLVDLAADLTYARPANGSIVLDQHLGLAPTRSQLTGVTELSRANQAVGILISHGFSPDEAEVELARRAHLADHSLYQAAQSILARAQDTQKDEVDP